MRMNAKIDPPIISPIAQSLSPSVFSPKDVSVIVRLGLICTGTFKDGQLYFDKVLFNMIIV